MSRQFCLRIVGVEQSINLIVNHRIVHKHPAFIVFLYIIEHLYEITQCQMEQKEARICFEFLKCQE